MINQFREILINNEYQKSSIYSYLLIIKNLILFVNLRPNQKQIMLDDTITAKNINSLIDVSQDYNNTLKSVSNKLKTLVAIKSLIKNSNVKPFKIEKIAKLEEDFEKILKVRDDRINKNYKSPKYERDELNNLLRIFFTPQTQQKLDDLEKFLLSLYILTPPLRNNYYRIIYYKNKDNFDKDENFNVKIYKNKMIINKKILKVDVNDNIETILTPYQQNLLENINLDDGEYLLDLKSNYTSLKIKEISFKVFNKKYGINDYRHIFSSALDINKLSNENLKNIALKMNQTQISTFLSYRKFK